MQKKSNENIRYVSWNNDNSNVQSMKTELAEN